MEISRPWQSTAPGDAGPYSAAQWTEIYKYLLHNVVADSGTIIDSGSAGTQGLFVFVGFPAGAFVNVLPGAALVDGTFYLSDTTEQVNIPANASGQDRIDTVILTKDTTAQTVRLGLLAGVPAAVPVPTALTQNALIWEVPLADVYVANGFVSIGVNDVTPRHEYVNAADGVYLTELFNNSGVTLETGDVVIWDYSGAPSVRAVTTTARFNDPNVAGVVVGRAESGDYCRVLTKGIGYVRVDNAAYANGTGLYTSATTKQAAGVSGVATSNLGILIDNASSATLRLASIDVQRRKQAYARYSYTVAAGVAGPAYNSGADRQVSLNTEDIDPNGIGALAGNQVTLIPGRYRIECKLAITGTAGTGHLMLYDITAGAIIATGPTINQGAGIGSNAMVSTMVEISAANVYELRWRATANSTSPVAINVAPQDEVYTVLEVNRMD